MIYIYIRMSVSEQTQQQNEQHLVILITIMDSLEECLSLIPDKNYKVIMENLGLLHEKHRPTFHEIRDYIFENDPITIQVARRATATILNPLQKLLSDDEKLKNGYVRCIKCNCVVKDLATHQRRVICDSIKTIKKITLTTSTTENADFHTNLNRLKRAIKSRGYEKKFFM